MDVTLAKDDPDWGPEADRVLREQVRRLELSLVRDRGNEAALLVSCRATEQGLTALRIELTGAGPTRVVDAVVEDLEDGISRAFEDLIGQVRPQQQQEDHAVAALTRAFPAFVNFAERELALYELEGRIPGGSLDPGDAIDEVVADVLPRLPGDASPALALARLQRALVAKLRALAAKADALDERGDGAGWPRPAGGLADAEIGDEDPDAWFPQEDVDLVELLRDAEAIDPSQAVEEQEARARLVRAMFRLEDQERRDWAEVMLGGWAVDALAAAQGRTEEQLRFELEQSRRFLAKALGVSEGQVDELYRALGERYRDERRDL